MTIEQKSHKYPVHVPYLTTRENRIVARLTAMCSLVRNV